jgi:hypothetical protein
LLSLAELVVKVCVSSGVREVLKSVAVSHNREQLDGTRFEERPTDCPLPFPRMARQPDPLSSAWNCRCLVAWLGLSSGGVSSNPLHVNNGTRRRCFCAASITSRDSCGRMEPSTDPLSGAAMPSANMLPERTRGSRPKMPLYRPEITA